MVFPCVTFTGIRGRRRLSDFEFLSIKEFGGKLIHELSAVFSTDADQVTYTVPNGKTFYHLKSKLYPSGSNISAGTTASRGVNVQLTLNGTVKDVLTFTQASAHATGGNGGAGSAAATGEFETNLVESMVGDGVKQIKLTSTGTSGSYRVSLMGIIETTGTSPKIT